jgi:hypothetical protein
MLKILQDLAKYTAAVTTDTDEKSAKMEAAESSAASIIARMAAAKAGKAAPETVTDAAPPKAPKAAKPETDADADAETEEYDAEKEAAKLDGLDGLDVEILGCFVRVGGETKKHQAALKELKFRWSSDKKKWYKRPPTYFKKSKRKWTFEEIENTFRDRKAA